MEEKINKRTTKDSIEYLELQCIVNNKIHDYILKYHSYPKYIKLPLWIFDCLKQTMCEVDLKIDYKTEEFLITINNANLYLFFILFNISSLSFT